MNTPASPRCAPENLRARAIQGDPTVVEDLFACYRNQLGHFLQNRCGRDADAEDALQDTFVAATAHLDSYRGESATLGWLYRIAANACTRMRRGRKNNSALHISLSSDDSHQSHHASASEPNSAHIDAVINALPRLDLGPTDGDVDRLDQLIDARTLPIRDALKELSETDRAVLLLRDAEGLSAKEVAELLHLTESAVKSRLHRARLAVRTRLGTDTED